MSGQQELVLGSLDLLGETDSFTIEALGDDGSWGAPQSIDVTLKSLLQDGSVVVTQGYDNRETSLQVRISADDSDALAAGEAALFAELGKRNTLTWVPPDGWGQPTVFEVITSHMEHVWDDVAETLRTQRTYGITLTCEPFSRSAKPFTIAGATVSDPATTPPPPTTVNDGTSATNWTYSSAPTAAGSENLGFSVNPLLKLAYQKTGVKTTHVYELTSTFSVGAQKYLALDWQLSGPGATLDGDISPSVMVNNPASGSPVGGITLARAGQVASPDNPGYTRTLWVIPSSVPTITRVRFSAVMNSTNGNTSTTYQRGYSVRLVQLTSQPLSSGTSRQKTMTVTVPGSAPTVGSLQVSHPSTALGDLLVYSYADNGCGYSPAMRKFRTGGGTITSDSSTYSGASETISAGVGPVTYDIPTSQLPSGLYVMYARLKRTAAGSTTIQVSADTRPLGGGQPYPGSTTIATSKSVALNTAYDIVPIGRLQLPTVDAGANGQVHLSLSNPGDGTVTIDELYLCNATIGRTTLVNARLYGTTPVPGSAPSVVWINSPSTDSPRPSVVGGTQADGSDAFNVEALTSANDSHRWTPPTVSVFTACNALDATTTLTGYARWHTHAGSDDGTA